MTNQNEWCFDITKAPEMETLEIFNPEYPSGNLMFGYLSDGGGNISKYGEPGYWMTLERCKIFAAPHAWRKPSPPGATVSPPDTVTNCHSTMLLEEVFSSEMTRTTMSINLKRRVRNHLAKIKLMGAG